MEIAIHLTKYLPCSLMALLEINNFRTKVILVTLIQFSDSVEIHRLMMITVLGALQPTSSRDGLTVQFQNASFPAPATLPDRTTQSGRFETILMPLGRKV